MSVLPVLFVSHGSPMLALDAGVTGKAWRRIADELPTPRAILVVSAHWMSHVATVSTSCSPATVHDFYGFPEPLYRCRYEPPGAPALAQQIAASLSERGMQVAIDPARGLDHGAWVPLMNMYPNADIPVCQLSIQPRENPAHHFHLGRALTGLAKEGVLILASGSMTHNLRDIVPDEADGVASFDYVTAFRDWIAEKLAQQDIDALLDYRRQAPFAQRAHPSDEHLLPLFVALGAAGEGANTQRVYANVLAGALAMDAYSFA